ncbi:peptide deformylase [Carnimonas nigrificans]|uniref:peptide deformylase n=1 Tax=Carnimonas nigrificans TaxID=64323 RepID=UPI000472EE7B|nr:peptide deformylase [Carnimonas nigrificans]
MALLTILEYPDEHLRTVAQPVTDFGDQLQTLIDDMFETMYAAPGIGLAGAQVDQHLQLFVLDVSEHQNDPRVYINPVWEALDDERKQMQEGCLSIPEYYAEVPRALRIKVSALDRHGKPFEHEADGLLAHCIQHETDHTKGVLFIDYLSPLKRERVKKKMLKRHKASV